MTHVVGPYVETFELWQVVVKAARRAEELGTGGVRRVTGAAVLRALDAPDKQLDIPIVCFEDSVCGGVGGKVEIVWAMPPSGDFLEMR